MPQSTEAPANTPTVAPTETPTVAPTETPTAEPTKTPSPTLTPIPTRTPVATDKKIIAFTFDDGPDYDTSGMLDVLAKHNVKATFFIKGLNLEYADYQPIIKRTAQEGHELANHTYIHPDIRNLTDEEFLLQQTKTNDKIKELTGQTPTLFRPPSGNYTQHLLEISPMPFILWTIDSWDWYRISPNPVAEYATKHNISEEEATNQIANQILFEHGLGYLDAPAAPLVSRLSHGAIILFHDVHPGTAVVVDKLLTYIEEQGEYTVMTVSDMLATIGTGPTQGKIYRSAWPMN
ncbi:MAG: polysaccharide deacetylase family protein [Clostridia bacterium]|nr:polysaccharide deacetylase family protein [Clostridia bacterium]